MGTEMGDHMTMARYLMLRITELHNVVVSFSPKPKEGDWNGAGCHTNFSIKQMRSPGGYDVIIKVCEAFGAKRKLRSTLMPMVREMTSVSQGNMKLVQLMNSNMVWQIEVHQSAFHARQRKMAEAIWRTGDQLQTVIRML